MEVHILVSDADSIEEEARTHVVSLYPQQVLSIVSELLVILELPTH